jgi:hypothetical protein
MGAIISTLFPTIETIGIRENQVPTMEEQQAFELAIAQKRPGPILWNFFNALAFLILVTLVLAGTGVANHQSNNVQEIKANWKKYRCLPYIMPFAEFFGHNTTDNFQYCMKNIFTTHAQETTSPFTSVLTVFAEMIGKIFSVTNSIRENIATMGGGLQVIFQDFTDRIINFFFKLRLSAIRIKNMIGRMQALLFSVMFMGMAGIQGGINLSNTSLFKFIAMFCFVPDTLIHIDKKGYIPIADVQIGDVCTSADVRSRVTAKFHFATPGQPMVNLRGVQVSAHHYVLYQGEWIQSMEHPEAIPIGGAQHSLICLNTEDHQIPIRNLIFRDYDETAGAGHVMMQAVMARLNARATSPLHTFEYSPTVNPTMQIRMADGTLKEAQHIGINDMLSTGSRIAGVIHKEVYEVCPYADGYLGSATLIWYKDEWIRIGTRIPPIRLQEPQIYRGFVVLPFSQMELHTGARIRDYIEIASPDIEEFYQEELRPLGQGDGGHTKSAIEIGF